MVIRNSYDNDGDVRYDCAIDGTPFFTANTSDTPLVRDTGDWARDSLDDSTVAGESSLTGWWYRTQSSFHHGAGLVNYEPSRVDAIETTMFADSMGVDVWTPGVVTLLHDVSSIASIASADSSPLIATYDIGGTSTLPVHESGVLLANGGLLYKVKSDGTTDLVDYGGDPGSDIFALTVSGPRYYVASNAGLYSGDLYAWLDAGTVGTAYYSFDPSDAQWQKEMGWIKDRFIAGIKNRLYELAPDGDSDPVTLPAPLYTHPLKGWRWTAFASGPDCIYASGYRGSQSTIFATTLETSEAGSSPTLSVPYVVVDMPQDEQVLSMISYMGTYLIIGTTFGVRVCVIGSDGQVTLGPLSVKSDLPVYALSAVGKYVYAGGSLKDSRTGMYRLDLANPVDAGTLRYPWARDLSYASTKRITSIAEVGVTGRMAFVTAAGNLLFESSTPVSSGYLVTGKIQFGTWENKQFHWLRLAADMGQGNVSAYYQAEVAGFDYLGAIVTASEFLKVIDGADGLPHPWISYKFVLEPASSGDTTGPRFQGYQLRANPSGVKPRAIRLALLCQRTEKAADGKSITRPTWPRITAMESLESLGSIVNWQDYNTGEDRLVIVDRVQFIADHNGENRAERSDPGGVLLVTLRTAEGE